MADDSSNYDGSGGNDDGGLAEREAALKRCVPCFFPVSFLSLARERGMFTASFREKEREEHELREEKPAKRWW